MNRRLASFMFFCGAFAAARASAVAAPITTPSGIVGPYRLAFVTSTKTLATSSDIAYYNAFVTTAASSVPELAALGTTWNAIASTAAIDARDNTSTNYTLDPVGVPIYNLASQLVASSNAALWGNGTGQRIQGAIRYDETGTNPPLLPDGGDHVWTGTNNSGVMQNSGGGGQGLGSTPASWSGAWNSSTSAWVAAVGFYTNGVPYPSPELPVYALSGILTAHAATAGGGPTAPGGVAATFGDDVVGTFSSTYFQPTNVDQLIHDIGAIPANKAAFLTTNLLGAYQVWEMGFSGTFTGLATIVLHYDPVSFAGGKPFAWHYENGSWVMPPNQVVDPIANTITFQTGSFSPFTISSVPEPSTIALAVPAVLAALTCLARRRGRSGSVPSGNQA